MINELKNKEQITIELFGKDTVVTVFSRGDNRKDENGKLKDYPFELSEKELEVLNWFVDEVKIEDYKQEIMDYCNNEYSMYSDERIGLDDVENEITITSIAINVKEKYTAYDGTVYPEISFYGECKCDEEHGICIAFRDKKFLGIGSQDWTL